MRFEALTLSIPQPRRRFSLAATRVVGRPSRRAISRRPRCISLIDTCRVRSIRPMSTRDELGPFFGSHSWPGNSSQKQVKPNLPSRRILRREWCFPQLNVGRYGREYAVGVGTAITELALASRSAQDGFVRLRPAQALAEREPLRIVLKT